MKSEKLNAIFMGTSDFAGIVLKSLLDNGYEFSAIVTQPDNKSGKSVSVSPVKRLCLEEKIENKLLQPETLDKEFVNKIKKLSPDIIIVVAYGKILPEEILKIPRFKSINVHASLLPLLRGPSPIQNALLQEATETGSTIMIMDKGVDTGDILTQKKMNIEPDDDYITLTGKLAIMSAKLLMETLPKWIAGKIKPRKQDSDKATLCQLIEKSDGKIIWDDEARNIYNKFRAFCVWPGIFTFWENKDKLQRITLTDISFDENLKMDNCAVGEVAKTDNGKIVVQTGKGVVTINKLQLEGKKETSAQDFLNGYQEFVGSLLK